jgi:hypothetical protein
VDETQPSINENDSAVFKVVISGAQGTLDVVTTLTGDSEANTVSDSIGLTGGTVTLNIGELFNEGVVSLNMSFTDGSNRTKTATLSFELINTSAEQSITDYSRAMTAFEAFSTLTVESTLYERAIQIVEFTNDDYVATPIAFDDLLVQGSIDDLFALINERDEVVENYNSGTADEKVFLTKISEAEAAANTLVNPVNTALHEVIESTLGVIPSISFVEVILDPEMGIASQFIGNTNLGAYEVDVWTFSPSYNFLSAIVFADELTCNAE